MESGEKGHLGWARWLGACDFMPAVGEVLQAARHVDSCVCALSYQQVRQVRAYEWVPGGA